MVRPGLVQFLPKAVGRVSLTISNLIFSLFLLNGLTSSLPSEAGIQKRGLFLIHSNDVNGELEPCGCRGNPQGGFGRKQNLLEQYREREGAEFLQVDAGDLFFAMVPTPDALKTQSELTARFLLKALEKTGLEVFTPGEKDFSLGTEFLRDLLKSSSIKTVSANLIQRKDSKLVFEPDVIIEKKGPSKTLRIGIFGLTSDSLQLPPDLSVLPPLEAAKGAIRTLQEKNVDLIVALTHQGLQQDQELASSAPGIDIVVGAHTQSFLQRPIKAQSTLIVQSSFRNQAIGVLRLPWPPTDEPDYQLIGLETYYASPEKSPNPLDQLVSRWKEEVAALNSLAAPGPTPSPPLAALLPQGAKQGIPPLRTFTGCIECHLPQTDSWMKTRHFKALEPLVKAKQIANKECLSCHSLGFGEPTGWSDVNQFARIDGKWKSSTQFAAHLKTKKLTSPTQLQKVGKNWGAAYGPVQCENCHRPSEQHPFSGGTVSPVPTQKCLECHTQVRAPKWYDSNGQPFWSLIEAKKAAIHGPKPAR